MPEPPTGKIWIWSDDLAAERSSIEGIKDAPSFKMLNGRQESSGDQDHGTKSRLTGWHPYWKPLKVSWNMDICNSREGVGWMWYYRYCTNKSHAYRMSSYKMGTWSSPKEAPNNLRILMQNVGVWVVPMEGKSCSSPEMNTGRFKIHLNLPKQNAS